MAKSRMNWRDVNRGDIISFNYNRKQRIVLVMETEIRELKKDSTRSELMHAIQLKVGNKNHVTEQTLLKLVGEIGSVFMVKEDGDDKYYKVVMGDTKQASKDAYSRARKLINEKDAYRTFDYNKLKASAVFRESYQELELLLD